MTDELGPMIGGYVDKSKQPRVMKQPTKDQLRAELAEMRAEMTVARDTIDSYKRALEFNAANANRAPWWRRLFT